MPLSKRHTSKTERIMFKTRNHQSTLASQQLLDEIELMSGQEMVELDSQELMNVVGRSKKGDTAEQQEAASVQLVEGTKFVLNYPPQGEATIGPTNPEGVATTKPV